MLDLTPVNDEPVLQIVGNPRNWVRENNPHRMLIANLETHDVDDDVVTLSVSDEINFEIVDGDLYLKAGRDFETTPNLSVDVTASDGKANVTKTFTVTITDAFVHYLLTPTTLPFDLKIFDMNEHISIIRNQDVTATMPANLTCSGSLMQSL